MICPSCEHSTDRVEMFMHHSDGDMLKCPICEMWSTLEDWENDDDEL